MMKSEKSQKPIVKEKSKRAFSAFINNVSWWWNVINFELDNSYIYKRIKTVTYKNGKTSQIITLPNVPRWKDVTRVQKGAYFAKFLAESKEFLTLKPFSLDFTYTLHDRYCTNKLSVIRDEFSKKIYNNLRQHGKQHIEMAYCIEGRSKRLHCHGFIDKENLGDFTNLLKQSACSTRNEYKEINYNNMLKFSEYSYQKSGGSYGWYCYIHKGSHSENAFHLSHSLLIRIRDEYEKLYEQYIVRIKQLEAEGFKIRYKDAKQKEYHKRFNIWKDIARLYKQTNTIFKSYISNTSIYHTYLIKPPPLI